MHKQVFLYELRHGLKTPIFYIFLIGFFLMAFVSVVGTGGYFDGGVPGGDTVSILNSPYRLINNSFLFTKTLLFVVALYAGSILYKDYQQNMHIVLYSFPLRVSAFLLGKGTASIFFISAIALALFIGIVTGQYFLGNEHPAIGDTSLWTQLAAYGLFVLPTLFTIGLFVFLVVGLSRNIYAGFMVVICFVLFQTIIENVFFNHPEILALLDPFGQNTFQYATMDWTVVKKNQSTVPQHAMILCNRCLWMALAIIAYFILNRLFDLQYDAPVRWQQSKKQSSAVLSDAVDTSTFPDIHPAYNIISQLATTWFLMKMDIKKVITHWMFWALSVLSGLAIFFILLKVTLREDIILYPLTRIVLSAPIQIYMLILFFCTFIFSRIILDRAVLSAMNYLVDASPVRSWQLYASKVAAIAGVHVLQLILFIIIGVIIQLCNGYYHFEWSLYAYHLLFLVFPVLCVWNVTSLFIHSVFQNMYVGLFALLILWMSPQVAEQLDITSYLVKFNQYPIVQYSDVYGYDYSLDHYKWMLLFWMCFAAVLVPLTLAIWRRGSIMRWVERVRWMPLRIHKLQYGVLSISLLSLLSVGNKIVRVDMELSRQNNIYRSSDILTAHKKLWGAYENLRLPEISALSIRLDIFPNQHRFIATGEYALINNGEHPIDTLFIRTGFDEETSLQLRVPHRIIQEDTVMHTFLMVLESSMMPKDTIILGFDVQNKENVLWQRNSNVLANGTVLRQDMLPRLGYQFGTHEHAHDDTLACVHHFYYQDAKDLHITSTVTTDVGQSIVAPGELIDSVVENGRVINRFKTSSPFKMNFSYHSADFNIKQDAFENIALSIYHVSEHEHTLQNMMDGAKASLDFNTRYFGPYTHRSLRIVEYPHTEGDYAATLTGNNVPTSEILFTVNPGAKNDKINLPFYVMAHEVTHHWFGGHLMPADAEGAVMLTESITEYITLCIYRDQFGPEMGEQFLAVQKDRYARGRVRERDREPPLFKVKQHQQYISYGKGAVAFHTLGERIGHDRLLGIISSFLSKTEEDKSCYPTAADFVDFLRDQTEYEHHDTIKRWFTEVVD